MGGALAGSPNTGAVIQKVAGTGSRRYSTVNQVGTQAVAAAW
jgi:hypothetical protein